MNIPRRPTTPEAEATARFDALPAARQMKLVREIVRTRATELTMAFDSVKMVTAGFRLQRDGDSAATKLHPQPCVILAVDLKWPEQGGTQEPESQRIPRRLLTYGSEGEERVLYAVPTDVQPQRWFDGAEACAASAIRVSPADPQFSGNGTMACVVHLQTGAQVASFGLSALHVLSPATVLDLPAPTAGASFRMVGSDAVVGKSAKWGGSLRRNAPSFDVQLADVGNGAWLGAAYAGLSLSPLQPDVVDHEDFDELAAAWRFLILVPGNHVDHLGQPRPPMTAQFRSYVSGDVSISYKVRANGNYSRMPITHAELLMLEVGLDSPPPEPGDSGSAVVTWRPDGTLTFAGIFIAGKTGADARTVFVLPAWQLFDLDNWSALPADTVRITPSFSLA